MEKLGSLCTEDPDKLDTNMYHSCLQRKSYLNIWSIWYGINAFELLHWIKGTLRPPIIEKKVRTDFGTK